MTARGRGTINLLPSGVPGLDAVLGGGLPEYSFNLIAGGPGAGKTTLAQQIAFARATEAAPALYFTVLGEPPLKLLRHAQHYSFFDPEKIGTTVRFINLGVEAMDRDLASILKTMSDEVEAAHPSIVIVDSFRTVAHATASDSELQHFVQRLALYLTGWQATTFLVGEYELSEAQNNPLFTIADGIFWLTQNIERNASVRRLQVTKMRARATLPGLHTLTMSEDGIRVFPRILPRAELHPRAHKAARASTGIPALDAMMEGGIPVGESALLVGPSGSGKSLFAKHFIAAGAQRGEHGIIAVFEEHPGDYLARAEAFGPELAGFIERGLIEVLYLRALELTVDETLAWIRDAVARMGAKRVAIDSLSGFELALAPSYRDDVREAISRTVNALTGLGVTALMTVDLVQSFAELSLSPHITEFLADVLVLQRYVELEGKLEKVLAVVKMRSSGHATDVRRYTIDGSGVVMAEAEHSSRSMLTGVPIIPGSAAERLPGLTGEEAVLLQALRELGESVPRALSRRTGLRGATLSRALDRLQQLAYARRVQRKGTVSYRANL